MAVAATPHEFDQGPRAIVPQAEHESTLREDGNGKAQQEEEEEEEEDVCRICRTTGDQDSPLFHPCACSGSIKYVHQECLMQWLSHSNARQCEVCKHPFAFSPVYAENAPARLPFRELLMGIAIKAGSGMHFFLRLAFFLSVWLIFIPFTTYWMWRFTFVRGVLEGQRLFMERLTPVLLFTDCLHGFLLSAGIVFIFLGVTLLREYFRHFREIDGHNIDREDEAVDRQAGARGGRGQGQGLAAGAGQIIRRNAENAAARLEAQVEQIFEGADDVDGAENVPFDELVGMQGPVFHLIENAITVLACNAMFLALVAFVPFTLGRIVLSSAAYIRFTGHFSAKLTAIPFLNNDHALPFKNASMVVNELILSPETFGSGNASFGVALLRGNLGMIEKSANVLVSSLPFSDVVTIGAGYSVILMGVSLYLGIMVLIRFTKGQPLTLGRIHGLVSLTEAAPSVVRQFVAGFKYLITMFKVAFLLFIELGLFPLLCGWWLDICTLSLLGGSIENRISFCRVSPFTSSMLHWLFGIVYMLQISMFVSLLREVLRPGVLYFLRDPADPNYNPFQDLINDPIHKHARRVLLSVLVYGSLIVMLIFLPIKFALSIAPSMFPLDIRISDPFTEIPADMLLFHICIPFAIEHLRPRATIKAVLSYWFSIVGWVLGLLEFLLPAPEERDEQRRPAEAHEFRQDAADMALPGDDNIEHVDIHDESDSEHRFVIRIILLLLGAWFTLLLFNSAIVLLPVFLGRSIFTSISRLPVTNGVTCNDLYAFNIGCYIIWATAAAMGYAIDYIKKYDIKVLAMHAIRWSAIVMKCFVLLSLWIIVIPVLIGLLFELLVVVPLRVPVDESAVFFLYQDWALGLVFLKIWTRLVMLDQMTPLADENWRLKFEQVKADGFSRVRGWWVLREIVAPVLVNLLTALCVPYVFARGLFPLFGYSAIVNSAVYRFAWSGCLMLVVAWYGARRLKNWFLDLHNAIRDDRYLVGKRLHNYGENGPPPATSKKGSEDSECGSEYSDSCTVNENSDCACHGVEVNNLGDASNARNMEGLDAETVT